MPSKRAGRWSGRVQSSPVKKMRYSDPSGRFLPESTDHSSVDPDIAAQVIDHELEPTSPQNVDDSSSTDTNRATSTLTENDPSETISIPLEGSNTGGRPQRNRHPPKALRT